MDTKDYYAVLGIPQDATDQQIKDAYRRLAMQFHPDRNHGDKLAADRFGGVSEAFTVLSDPERRVLYDSFGSARVHLPTLTALFSRHPDGRRFLERMLPRDDDAPQFGVDQMIVLRVSEDLLRNGGKTNVSVRGSLRVLDVPPNAHRTPWCKLEGEGERGIRGGESGDLWVMLLPADETHQGQKRGSDE